MKAILSEFVELIFCGYFFWFLDLFNFLSLWRKLLKIVKWCMWRQIELKRLVLSTHKRKTKEHGFRPHFSLCFTLNMYFYRIQVVYNVRMLHELCFFLFLDFRWIDLNVNGIAMLHIEKPDLCDWCKREHQFVIFLLYLGNFWSKCFLMCWWIGYCQEADVASYSIYVHAEPGFVFDESTTRSPIFYGRQLSNSIEVCG